MSDNTSVNAAKPKKKSKALRWLCIIFIAVILGLGGAFLLAPLLESDIYGSGTARHDRAVLPKVDDSDKTKKTNVWKERDSSYRDIEYRCIYYSGKAETVEQNIEYYEFESRRKARKVYKLMKKDGYDPINEEGSNYFVGWEKGVMDASIEKIVCLYDNLIITTELYVGSEWASSPDDPTPRSFSYPERKDYILQNFGE